MLKYSSTRSFVPEFMGEYRAHKTAATANLTASKQQLAHLIKINKGNHIVRVTSPPVRRCVH